MTDPRSSNTIHVLLIDGLNIIRRVHAGVPGDVDTDVHFDATCNSVLASIRKALRRHQPTHAALVMDGEGLSWRKEQFADYKVGRTPMPDRLRSGLPVLRQSIEDSGIKTLDVDGYEADDTIATMAVAIGSNDRKVTILSSDKHFGQVVNKWVTGYDHFADRSIDADAVVQRFGVPPDRLATLFALTGDSGVNVSGVKGIGPKTGARLVQEHHELENILSAAAERSDAIGKRLQEQQEQARFALHLLSLRLDIPIGFNLKELRVSE